MKKYAKTLLRILISTVLIAYLVQTQDFGKIFSNISNFSPIFLILSLLLLLFGTYISSLRWKTILKTSKIDVNVWFLYTLYLKGYFYNNFLPTQMGGDVYKSVSLGNKIKDQSVSLFSVFMDRFSGLVLLLVVGLLGIGSLYGFLGVLVSLGMLVIGLALYFPVLNIFAKKIKFLRKFKEASELFIKDKQNGSLVLFYSLLVQIISFTTVYSLFVGLGVWLPLNAVIAFMPIASLSLLIPSFNGFGTQELVYSFLFANVGVTAAVSITASILNHAVRLTISLIAGVLILFDIDFSKIFKN